MTLEPFTDSHTGDAYRLWSDFEAVKFTNWSHTPTPQECSERAGRVIAHYAREPLHFGPYAIRMDDHRFVGMVGADLADRSLGEYDIWYILCREEWGRGIATQALGELIARMRASGRAARATASVVAGNEASLRLLERRGFSRDEAVPGGFQRHGLTLDLYRYSRALDGAD